MNDIIATENLRLIQMKKVQDLSDHSAEFISALSKYKYQPNLTEKLDKHEGDFTDITFLEIVLWKTNRYPTITQELIDGINNLRKSYTEEKAKNLLQKLLSKEMKGFDLPMASTVL